MPQIQHFPDFILKDYWPDSYSMIKFQALNFYSIHGIRKFKSLETSAVCDSLA